jgi:hypothetical protein
MLHASFRHWIHASRKFSKLFKQAAEFDIAELMELVDRFMVMQPLRRGRGGISGHHAWIGIVDRGFSFHAYFGEDASEDVIDFDICGPYALGTEHQEHDPYDGSCLAGTMTSDTLKQVIHLLDADRSPTDFIKEHALEVRVVED